MRVVFMLVAMAAGALAQAPQAGRLEGRVTTPEGKPVSRATVRLQSSSVGQSTAYIEVTASDGTFAVESIPPGVYMPNVNRQGYVTPGMPFAAARPVPITVGPGQRVSVELKLTPLAIVSGAVLDPAGEPVPNVNVRLMRYNFVNGSMNLTTNGVANVDDQGQFRIINVQPGRYYLVAVPNPLPNLGTGQNEIRGLSAQETELQTYYPGSAEIRGATMINVQSAPMENLRFRMIRGRTYPVRGTVSGFDASGNQRPSISAMRSGEMGGGNVFVQVRPDGQFEMPGAAPGEYTLIARMNPPGAAALMGRATVRVGNAAVEGVAIRMTAGLTLTGHLSIEGVDLKSFMTGLNANRGTPPPGVNLPRGPQLMLNPTDLNGTGVVQVTTGEDGSLEAKGLQPMRYTLTLSGYAPGLYVKQVRLNGRDITREAFDLSSGSDAEVEVVLSPKVGTIALTLPAELAGAQAGVYGIGGGTAATATSMVLAPGFGGPGRMFSIWPATPNLMLSNGGVSTIGGGPNLRSQGLAPGDYYVAVWEETPQALTNVPEFLARFNAMATRVTVHEGETVTVEPKVIGKDAAQKVVNEFP